MARNAEGKVVFVEGALPGEQRRGARVPAEKPTSIPARATPLLAALRRPRAPRCPHFGVCGGCAMQHADARTQMAAKQRWLEDASRASAR